MIEQLITDAFWSGIAALGFGMLFNVPRRTLWGCVLCGAVGHMLRTLGMEQFDLNIVVSTLLGSLAVGFLGDYLARYWRTPAPIFSVTGVIPMVPGVFAYQTMFGLIDIADASPSDDPAILLDTAINGVQTALILAALAIGIIAPQLLFQRRKPIV